MEKTAREQLAQKVRLLRFLRGWSQEKLAEHSGLHRTYISTIERAGCNVGLDNLERLAAAFRIPVQSLLGLPDRRTLARLVKDHTQKH